MTTPGIAPGQLPVDVWARVVRSVAEAFVAGSDALLRASTNGATTGSEAADLDVVIEVLQVIARPGRPGEPQRVELYCLQRGPLPPTPPFALWVTWPAGHPLPQERAQFRLAWSPV